MGFKNSHITSILYALLASVAVSFLIFEWYHLKNEQNQKDIQNIASQSVEQSFNQFQSQIFEFSSSSTEFANEITKLLISNQHLNNIRSIASDFWGVSVYKEKLAARESEVSMLNGRVKRLLAGERKSAAEISRLMEERRTLQSVVASLRASVAR